jgi:uncharacterized protein (DUF952 family)
VIRHTFHLSPVETWATAVAAFADGRAYEAASLATEGFIHCTDGVDALGATFDRYYAADQRPFVALTVDLDALDALDVPWRYDVADSPYPHIYGAIPRIAIVDVQPVRRSETGRFVGLAASTVSG